jgi:hypothetical protein
MPATFPAVLRGDRLEWTGEPPTTGDAPVRVQVTVLSEPDPPPTSDGERMAAALARLAALGESSFPADAAGWQREERADRPIPGRE